MVVADVVERRAQRLHGAVDRGVRHQLFQQAPLLVLAGAARCGHDAPLIAYLSDVRLIEVVKECLSTENAFDPGEFASRRLFCRLAADDHRAMSSEARPSVIGFRPLAISASTCWTAALYCSFATWSARARLVSPVEPPSLRPLYWR